MTKINQIILKNYRNFEFKEILFSKKLNIFFGHNGSGKTNILESISLINKGRGIRNAQFLNIIRNNTENFLIKSLIEIQDIEYDVKIFTKKNDEKIKKIVEVNNENSKDSNSFINKSLSNLIFLPEMERLFQSNPSNRRNFIDRLIFSERIDYNQLINKYKKRLLERSKIIREYKIDDAWIKIIENEISEIGIKIYQLRNLQLDILNNNINILNKSNNYNLNIKIHLKDNFYSRDLDVDKFNVHLKNSREFDKHFGGSKIGPHKSDFIVLVDNNSDASQLSTGQQKTIILMLLLAQCNYLVNFKRIEPVLLFDEICSHLDSFNRKILLDMINNFNLQFFLTGTDKTLFSFVSTNAKFYNITNI